MSDVSVSRRDCLRGAGALGLIAAMGPGFAQAAAAAPGLSPAALETLRSRWVDQLTGRRLIPASPGTFADAIAELDARVSQRLGLVAPTPTQFFSDRSWIGGPTQTANSNNMRRNYVDLQTLSVAWATPGSSHEGSSAVLDTVLQGLRHMHEHVYNERTQWWGNWWSWLIGATRPLSDVMAILHPVLDQAEIDSYCRAMDHFLPDRDPTLQIHPNGVQKSEGANRVDICQAFIVRSIVQPDTALLQKAIDALSPTWQYVTDGNGIYRDGSFIQHSTIPYTGTYGLVFLSGLSKLFALLAGTAFDITDSSRTNLTSSVDDTFSPLMYNGQMMDAVRGRAVSRETERSIDNGNDLIESTLLLAQAVDATRAARWRGLCRQWIEGNDAATILDTTSIVRLALVSDLLNSSIAPVPDSPGPRMFPAMDRLVHRGQDNDWALTVAMCSNRISWSEGTGSENFHGCKTSQGMTYLYLADDDNHFDDEFWATSDLDAPAGTTVDLTDVGKNPEGTWGGHTPDNEWTGGVQMQDRALAAMHLVAPGGTGLVARKTWLTLPNAVVALGTDISTQSGNEVRSVVEHRNLGTSPRRLTVDGQDVTGLVELASPRWAHLEGVGGYAFLDDEATIRADVSVRRGAWHRNNNRGTTNEHARNFGTLAYTHGSGAEVAGSSYAYVLLPGASAESTRSFVSGGQVTVLRNDATVQAVAEGPMVTGAAFWTAGSVGDYTVDRSACLLVRKTPGMALVAVSDPTQAAEATIVLTMAQARFSRVRGTDAGRVRLSGRGDTLTLHIDTSGLAGQTVNFTLHL